MIDYQNIFQRHYFSNHHHEAQNLEKYLSFATQFNECVLLSSFEVGATFILDELLNFDESEKFTAECRYEGQEKSEQLKSFLCATGRSQLKLTFTHEAVAADLSANIRSERSIIVKSASSTLAILLDLGGAHSMINSLGVFLSQEPKIAEKARWYRSSYGRQSDSNVMIQANGRVSEFQALTVMMALSEVKKNAN